MGEFNPADFMNQTFNEANDTSVTPVPVGEFMATCDKVDIKTWQSKDGSASGLKLFMLWEIDDEEVKKLLDRPKVIAKGEIMLDTTESGNLDTGKGKNARLGRLREAVNLNESGAPFSFAMIQGRSAKVKIKHRVDGADIYAEIEAYARPS